MISNSMNMIDFFLFSDSMHLNSVYYLLISGHEYSLLALLSSTHIFSNTARDNIHGRSISRKLDTAKNWCCCIGYEVCTRREVS